jgi:hypothetical protein
MKYALPLMILATPVFAHEGVHAHPHGSEGWLAGLALVSVSAAVAIFKMRKAKAESGK